MTVLKLFNDIYFSDRSMKLLYLTFLTFTNICLDIQ